MSSESDRSAASIATVLLIVIVCFMIYNMAEINAYNPFVLWGGLLFGAFFVFQYVWGDWFASILRAPPEFVTFSGVGGRLISGPSPIPGGRMSARVSFNRSIVPKVLKKDSEGGIFGFLGNISGTLVIDVVGAREQFVSVDKNDCENKNGCVFFKGRLDGAELRDPEVMSGLTQLKRLSDLYRSVVSTMKLYGQELHLLINQRHLDDDYTYNRAKMIADNMKNVKIITKGGGGADAVAAEMT